MTDFKKLCAVGFAARFSYALARNPVLPLFALFLGAGPEAVGLAVGISTVTGIFFKLPAGAVSDVVGRRRTMIAGLVVFAVMPFAYLLIESYNLLVLVRFLHGLATAVYGPVVMAVVADYAGDRKGELLSLFSSVGIIGGLLGAPLGGLLLHHSPGAAEPGLWHYRAVFLVSGVLGVAALVLALKTLTVAETIEGGNSLSERVRHFFAGIREVLSNKRVVVVSSMEGVQNMTMGALEAFLPLHAVKTAGLSELQAGLLWALQIVVTILAKPAMGKMSDKLGRRSIITTGLVCCALSFAAIPFFVDFASLAVLALVFGLGEAFVTSSSAALVADLCRKARLGAAMGAFGTIFDIGHAAGPILAGLLVGAIGMHYTFPLMAIPLLIAIPVFLSQVSENDVKTGS